MRVSCSSGLSIACVLRVCVLNVAPIRSLSSPVLLSFPLTTALSIFSSSLLPSPEPRHNPVHLHLYSTYGRDAWDAAPARAHRPSHVVVRRAGLHPGRARSQGAHGRGSVPQAREPGRRGASARSPRKPASARATEDERGRKRGIVSADVDGQIQIHPLDIHNSQISFLGLPHHGT